MSELGKDDGVVLLVNPGFKCPYIDDNGKLRIPTDEDKKAQNPIHYAEAFTDDRPFARQWLIDQEGIYEQIIECLRTKKNGGSKGDDLPVVAVVVTASDRLEPNGDLYDRREHFGAFLDKVTNRLTGFEHETFYVSVTGHLEDQNKPALASGEKNTSWKPFDWLLAVLDEREKKATQEQEKSKEKRRRVGLKKMWTSILGIAAVVAAIAGLCVGTFKWVAGGREQEDIATRKSAIVSSLRKTSLRSGDIKKAAANLNLLRGHDGFHAAEATKAADELEPSIWQKQKSLIDREIFVITDSQGRKGDFRDLAEVDDLFSAFKPTLANLAAEYNNCCANWHRQKVELGDAHHEYEFRENVEKPLRGAEMIHGISAMDKLYPITDTISRLTPSSERLKLAKADLARKVDARISEEWRNFAIRGFAKIAPTNATEKAVLAFQKRIDDWTPVSPSGDAAKSNIVAFVSANIPFWRRQYETTKFISKVDAAIKSSSMEDMAMYCPGQVATNEFLTAGFVEEQWKKRVKPVFEGMRKDYLDDIVDKSSIGRGCPALADGDKNDIKRKATKIGEPFDLDGALKYVEEHVNAKSEMWKSEKRKECDKWIKEKIRPDRSRTGQNSLWDDYTKEKRRTGNPFFVDVAGSAVYREVEKWFESDVAAFKETLGPGTTSNVPLWLEHDDGNFKIRYQEIERRFNEFKKTCRHVNEDKTPPSGTWAHRFAELCVSKGGVDNGINKAFVQCVVASRLDAMINYTINGKQKFPVNYKWTSFAAWFEVESFECNGCPMTNKVNVVLIDVDGKYAPKEEKTSIGKEDEGKYKAIWSDKKMLEAGLFQRTKFVVRATDYNGNGIKKTGDFTNVVYFVDKQQVLELNGLLHIGRMTGVNDAGIGARLFVEMSGETPFTLIEQAKRETRERGGAK